ncbi:MAG: hypothetical protein D6767_00685, partial [Candidatus Hydrogenedentota bacterium]
IRGVLRHRAFYHLCKIKQVYAENVTKEKLQEVEQSIATLLGSEAKDTGKGTSSGNISKIFFRDIILGPPPARDAICESEKDGVVSKIFNHVKIDRFTGGAIDGALFSERVLYGGTLPLTMEYHPSGNEADPDAKKAFLEALKDLANGLLPLGAASAKGHGFFTADFNEQEAKKWLSLEN